MPRKRQAPTTAQALIKAARDGRQVPRIEIPRVTCDRCGADVYAMSDGEPRAHQRATRPGEELYSAEIPTMTECEA